MKLLAVTLLFSVLCTYKSVHASTSRSMIITEERSSKSNDECDEDHYFMKLTGYLSMSGFALGGSLNMSEVGRVDDCREMCRKSCSCTGYFSVEVFSYANLVRCVLFKSSVPQIVVDSSSIDHFYIRVRSTSRVPPPTPTPTQTQTQTHVFEAVPPLSDGSNITSKKRWQWWIWVLFAAPPAFAVSVVAIFCCLGNRRAEGLLIHESKDKDACTDEELGKGNINTNKIEKRNKLGDELQMFRFKCICAATNQFSSANKLGEGGFGPVYRGDLVDGQEVAVKRLSRSSSQGMVEFKNEIKLIAKLQHKNLVKLLGCCYEGSERMLVYEFLPHKSLDSFLFDPSKKMLLDWKRRMEIIEGTAQGLLYLHKYSRLKVIHRDLKTSNILLDCNLNPKISDFGLARIFEHDKSAASTSRIVGTYGYMSPEYAMHGLYSEKSDVFSFGVIVLEILSGKKATSFSGIEQPLNLIRYAWDMWTEGKSLEFIDGTIGGASRNTDQELVRHIHVGLLCVEESATERPTMSNVVSMLTQCNVPMSAPKHPAFYCDESNMNAALSKDDNETCSLNLVTMSPIEAR